MTDEELRENRRLLQIEAKYLRLEKIFLNRMQRRREETDNWEDEEDFEREILK